MSGSRKPRRQRFAQIALYGLLIPAVLVAIGLFAEDHLGEAMRRFWWIMLLAFVVGACTAVLPRQFPLVASFVALFVFVWVSSEVGLAGLTLICLVLAGTFFGLLFARPLILQAPKTGRPAVGRP